MLCKHEDKKNGCHSCPYACEVQDDYDEEHCDCCEECTNECADEI